VDKAVVYEKPVDTPVGSYNHERPIISGKPVENPVEGRHRNS
jgi:hypothetical protein